MSEPAKTGRFRGYGERNYFSARNMLPRSGLLEQLLRAIYIRLLSGKDF